MPGARGTPEERFWRRVDKRGPDECWLWTGSRSRGHGLYRISASLAQGAHRFAYELLVGPIPDGLDIDHMCHNQDESCPGGETCLHRRCCNPAHLEPATRRENLLRGKTLPAAQVLRTHCPQGHPYSGDNLYVWRGQRKCRECVRASNRANYRRKKVA